MDEVVSFVALGIPSPGGSKSAFRNPRTGRIVVVDAGGKKTKVWRSIVAHSAREAMAGRELIAPPIALYIEFRMPRPKAHYTASGDLKQGAPWVPIVRPDATKLLRSTEDAMTGIVWLDDAHICEQVVHRVYSHDEHSGARISVFHVKHKNGETKTNTDWQEWSEGKPSLVEIKKLDESRRAPVVASSRPSVDRAHRVQPSPPARRAVGAPEIRRAPRQPAL